MHAASVLRICFACAAVTAIGSLAQTRIAAGEWSATLGPTGPEEIRFRDEPVAKGGRFAGYLPDWKGTRFAMGGADLLVEGATATWTRAVAGNQEATLRLSLSPEGVVFSLATTIAAAGPSEFSLQLPPEAVRTDERRCFGWLNGAGFEVPLDGAMPFEHIRGIREIRFEQPARTVSVRCEGFEIQDRRARGGDLYLVQVIGSSGETPRTVERSITIEIAEAPAAEVAGRAEFLSQRLIEYGDLDMANPAFDAEDPRQGWGGNPNSTIDAEVFRSAPRSLRLALTGTETDENPYVTRMIPIEAGSMYQVEAWIRTENVTPAAKRNMSATGATVILEFADREGKWFAAGSYAKGLYGTKGWTRVATDPVRAPAGSGYAIVFLSLRANGTAWFDDVKLSTVRYYTMLLAPLPGAPVNDNTPRFAWRTELLGQAVLQLSRDPAFPDDGLIEIPASGQDIELRQALEPGRWHWRVRIPELDDTSRAFAFEQTAPLDQDCTPPLVQGHHGYLGQPDLPAIFEIRDNADLAGARVEARVNGQPARLRLGEVTQDGEFIRRIEVLPPEAWLKGLNRVAVTVVDAAGNTATGTAFLTCQPPLPRTTWTTHHGIETDGKRRFLFGMYGIRTEDIPEMQRAGFDFVHNYAWDGAGSLESAIAYLDEVHARGMQAFIGLDRRRLQAGDEEFVAERVAALMDHPGLLCWYLFDEPDLLHQYVSPDRLERFFQLIKALDPFHPVIVTCAADAPVGQYRDTYDVHWTQVYGTTAHVASRLERHRGLMKPDWPLAAILHCYDRAQSGQQEAGIAFDPAKFQPDARVLRANAFMAVAKGSSGLLWWWWGQGSDRFLTISRVPPVWEALQRTVADIKSLEPILVADGQDHYWVEKTAEDVEVHIREKRTADRTLLIAVNREDKPCRLVLRPRTAPAGTPPTVLFEDRQATLADGQISEELPGLGVRVFLWP